MSIPDTSWLMDTVWHHGVDMGLFGLMGPGGREAHEHTAMELLPRITTAIIGALYIDGGMEAVTNAVGSYAEAMAQAML